MRNLIIITLALLITTSCSTKGKQDNETSPIMQSTISKVIAQLLEEHGSEHELRITRGVNRTASLWRADDGSSADFNEFCLQNFIADADELNLVFDRIAGNFEFLFGYLAMIYLEQNRQIHEDRGAVHPIDQVFSAYNPGAHVHDDLYKNKLAFIITLNFPSYSLGEKNELGADWNARQWGFARLGDMFTARVPPSILQDISRVYSEVNLYISEYNVFADQLRDNQGEQLFPDGMKLLSHWNIRDEIKSNYDLENGLPKQEMLYKVMLRIINQDIPKQAINNNQFQWNPYSNQLFSNGSVVDSEPEGVVRYQHLLNSFQALQKVDSYYPNHLNTYVKRSFESNMEIPMDQVKALFKEYAASPLIRSTASLIAHRLGRELRPFDLWYNGFVGRGGVSEDELNRISKRRYPNAQALEDDLDNILIDLGFSKDDAKFLSSKIEVNAARGSGHAYGASMRQKPSLLRTRIGPDGMDYKGYNIAMHELGHNVEQTISLHKVDNYFVKGVPNTAFTEALAFMFQKRDLQRLGVKQTDPLIEYLEVLDVFWDNYEMMGISLLDMMVWEWLYQNPSANAQQLKEAVIAIAKDVWNEYYADVFGERDNPILAIYSHMIMSPLYLMNYPYGRLIMFQLEDYIADRNFANEVLRIFALGELTPQHWMKNAVGTQISNQPIFDAVEKALRIVGE